MTKLDQLKAATDRKELAKLLGFEPKALAYIVYKKPNGIKYFPFEIQKRSGGKRTIHAPAADLKGLQSRLSQLLQDCISDINSGKKISGSLSHGFRRKKSVITNARCHRGKRWVFNLDLEAFFDNINFGRVRGFFLSNNNFTLNSEVATTIAQIACYNNALPQGSPCSPVLSNLIAHVLDVRLAALAEQCGCTYSRYADDLTFSTNKPVFPKAIARRDPASREWLAGKGLSKIIKNSGFTINAAKTRMQYHGSRQDVTGLVVNRKVNVKREYERAARAMTESVLRTGAFYTIEFLPNAAGEMEETQVPGTLEKLQGIHSYINHVKKSQWNKLNKPPKERVGYECTYRQFLFHKRFYANERPLIMCEGKTDNIYLKCAIRSLAANFAKLAEKKNKTTKLKVEFMSYTETTGRMLDVLGGTGDLKKFVGMYSGEWAENKAGHKKQPVIMVVDNDKGSPKLFGAVASVTGNPVLGTEKFIHIRHNLYLVPLPKVGGKDTMLEDFFAKSVQDTKLGGKSFSHAKSFDKATQYGKNFFAERVVRPNQATIDFSKFAPILEAIEEVIDHYSALP